MNKIILSGLIALLLLAGCGEKQSWQDEEIVQSERIITDDVNVVWTLGDGEEPHAGENTRIRLEVLGKGNSPIENFDINHEKLLHLMIISKDLSYFNHVHPEYVGKGVFEIENTFPGGGEYKVIADFKPSEGNSMTKMDWVSIGGEALQPQPIELDAAFVETVQGNRVTFEPGDLATNKEHTITFTLEDEATNQPITDLQPYLGAIGHVVVLSENGEQYLHVHAVEGQGTGPEAKFETEFPTSGIYKIWGQFQRNDEVFTVSYVVKVP